MYGDPLSAGTIAMGCGRRCQQSQLQSVDDEFGADVSDVLPGRVGADPLQDLHLALQHLGSRRAPQPAPRCRRWWSDPRTSRPDCRLTDPVRQARLAAPQVLPEGNERFTTGNEVEGSTPKFRRLLPQAPADFAPRRSSGQSRGPGDRVRLRSVTTGAGRSQTLRASERDPRSSWPDWWPAR